MADIGDVLKMGMGSEEGTVRNVPKRPDTVNPELQQESRPWQEWLNRVGIKKGYEDLDERLREIVIDPNCKSLVFEYMKHGERKWIHHRCDQLGLKSKSGRVRARQSKFKEIKDLVVAKPERWALPKDALPDPPKSRRPHKRTKVHRSVECEECGDDCEGLYHWNGMGPLCEDCIEADEELSGHKWEPR